VSRVCYSCLHTPFQMTYMKCLLSTPQLSCHQMPAQCQQVHPPRQVQWLTQETTEVSLITLSMSSMSRVKMCKFSGVHINVIRCEGIFIGFPCVDMHCNQGIISWPGTRLFSTVNRHCLLPVSRLMHHGFKFNYAIPANDNHHRFGKYKDYGTTSHQTASQLLWCITNTHGDCLLSRCQRQALKGLPA